MSANAHTREIAAECLNGRMVRDANGEKIGRIADIYVKGIVGALAVEHYWVAPRSATNRVAVVNVGWHVLRLFGLSRDDRGYHVRWEQMDLSDLNNLRTRCPKAELKRA